MAVNAVRQQLQSEQLKYELKAEEEVAKSLGDALMQVYSDMAAAYVRLTGDISVPLIPAAQILFKRRIRRALRGVPVNASKPLTRALKGALDLGVKMALRQIGKKVVVSPRPDRDTRRAVNKLDKLAKQDIEDAINFMKQHGVSNFDDLSLVMSKANHAVNRVKSTTRWATNRSINTGSTVVAKAVGADMLWVHEHGACLTCLAYSGSIVKSGQVFPAGKTFGDAGKSTVKEAISGPPAHPNCRCRLVPWLGSKQPAGSVEFPDALKREAERAVLRGTAYDSEAAKLRAADRLLKAGTSLPKTVKERARRAVVSGAFR